MSHQRHETAYVESGCLVGNKTEVGCFSVIKNGAKVGENCRIGNYCIVEKNAQIGENVTVSCHVVVEDDVVLEKNVYCGKSVVFQNKLFSKSNDNPYKEKTFVGQGCFLGDNSVLAPGITIGENAYIMPCSVVHASVPSHAVMWGNPAKQKGWVCSCGKFLNSENLTCSCGRHYVLMNTPQAHLEELK